MPVFIAFNRRDIIGTSLNSHMPTRHCISQSSLSLQNLVQLLSTQKGDKRATPSLCWDRNWNVPGETAPFPRLRWAGWLVALPGLFLQATTSQLHQCCGLHMCFACTICKSGLIMLSLILLPSAAALVLPLCSE